MGRNLGRPAESGLSAHAPPPPALWNLALAGAHGTAPRPRPRVGALGRRGGGGRSLWSAGPVVIGGATAAGGSGGGGPAGVWFRFGPEELVLTVEMGVPKFYRWISERYPCLSEVVKEHQVGERAGGRRDGVSSPASRSSAAGGGRRGAEGEDPRRAEGRGRCDGSRPSGPARRPRRPGGPLRGPAPPGGGLRLP